MRHRRKTVKLGRNSSHRRWLFRNLARSIIESFAESGSGVVSTLPKLKAVRPFVEKLVTVGVRAFRCERESASVVENAQLSSRRRADAVMLRRSLFRVLRCRALVEKTVSVVGERYESRCGGYVRISRLQRGRIGDGGVVGVLQWVDTASE